MENKKLYIGNHIHKEGKTYNERALQDIERAKSQNIDMLVMQQFAIGPQSTHETMKIEDKNALAKMNIRKIIHGSYFSNPWGKKPGFGSMLVKKELKIADEIKAEGVVVHLPRQPPERIATGIEELLEGTQSCIYLEIESYEPNEMTYETPDKLYNLFELIDKNIKNKENMMRIGICIDTAHLWAAGIDISTADGANKWLHELEEKMSKFVFGGFILHLNDQIWKLGGGRDEHAPLGYGVIWNGYNNSDVDFKKSGLYVFVNWAIKNNVTVILERKSDKPKINGLPSCDNIISDYKVLKILLDQINDEK